MECFGSNRCVGGEKGCRSIMGCLGRKWGALRCLGVKGVFGGVKGCLFGVSQRVPMARVRFFKKYKY